MDHSSIDDSRSITVESSYLAFPILSSIYGGQGGLGAAAAPASGRLSFGKVSAVFSILMDVPVNHRDYPLKLRDAVVQQKADNEGRHSKSHKAKQKQKADRDDEGEPDLDMSDVDDNDSGSGSSEGDAESSKQPTANGKKGGKLRFKQQQQKHKNEAQQTLQAPRPPPGHRKFWKPAGFEEASQPSRSIRDAKRQENIKTYGLETTGQDQAACDVTGGGDEDGLLASDDDDRGSDGSDFVGDMIAQARLKRKAGLPAGDLAGGSIVREDARETKRKRHRKPKQD